MIYSISITLLAVAVSLFLIWWFKWLGVYLVGMIVGASLIERFTREWNLFSHLVLGMYLVVTFFVARKLFGLGFLRKR
jgi:hypothetical protein